MSFCQHEYAVLQIAKIQKFFELTKNIFPSIVASLFNALYINTLFRNPINPFRIPFPFLRWPFSRRRWPSSFPLPIPPLFAHSPFHFSLFRPTCHLFPQLRTHRYNSFLPLIFLARFRFPVSINHFHSLPVFRFHALPINQPPHPIAFPLFQFPHLPQFHCLFLFSARAIGYSRNRFAFSRFKLLRELFLSAVVTKNSRRAYYVLKGKRR